MGEERQYQQQRMVVDYFELLGVSRDATLTDLKMGFYKRAKLLHPDVSVLAKKNPEAAKVAFQQLTDAFTTLKDPALRQAHCLMLDMRRRQRGGGARGPAGDGARYDPTDGRSHHGQEASTLTYCKAVYEPDDGWLAETVSKTGSVYDYSKAVYEPDDGWLARRHKEFHAAMAHAYVGPRFDPQGQGTCEEVMQAGMHQHVIRICK
ncbi:hypothetical protein JKP88DRAFT_273276 [Tribonema minus]|uniref:J domain-containing protein n=1 Tax=Tribonema minus TaxID=303371 RepID=A0A836CEQ7_9STRA|nr:hypothetical protein JKP88DRAFT_273276 [Tribonema minus]